LFRAFFTGGRCGGDEVAFEVLGEEGDLRWLELKEESTSQSDKSPSAGGVVMREMASGAV